MKKQLLCYGTILLLPGAWFGSEWLYFIRIRPTGIHTVNDHFRRFGEPRFAYEVQHDGSTFYEFNSAPRSVLTSLAVYSSYPAYVYDRNGRFVTWCADPGDQPDYRRAWQRVIGIPLDMETLHQRFPQ